jgi:hypothetical protein
VTYHVTIYHVTIYHVTIYHVTIYHVTYHASASGIARVYGVLGCSINLFIEVTRSQHNKVRLQYY